MPILSVMGSQCCPLPTAYLSTHTQFDGFTFLDMTAEMERAAEHWKTLGIGFEAIYTGFLGSAEQIALLEQFIRDFRTEETIVLVDPVMGDHGKTYRTYTPAMCRGMTELARSADLITPNLTEAAIFWTAQTKRDGEAETMEWAATVSEGKRSVALTGIARPPHRAACFEAKRGS
jgi:pyridoxine kinase